MHSVGEGLKFATALQIPVYRGIHRRERPMCRSEKCTTNGTERHAGRSLQGVCVKRKHLDKSEFYHFLLPF